MHDGQVQLLRRLLLSSDGKRRSNIGGADGGGAEHRVVGESIADMLTMGDGVCFSHLRGCRSSMASLVEADLLSSVFWAPGILGGPHRGLGSRHRDLGKGIGNFTSLVMTHLVSRPAPDTYLHPKSISGRLMTPKSVSRPGRVPNGQGSLWADPICHGG